jgi:transposase
VQAAVPVHLIEGGLPTEGALAHIGVSKYADHCPLFRQSQIYARSGLNIDRSTLAGWMDKLSFHLALVLDHLLNALKSSSKFFMDETRCSMLDTGRGKTKTGYLWAIARDESATLEAARHPEWSSATRMGAAGKNQTIVG